MNGERLLAALRAVAVAPARALLRRTSLARKWSFPWALTENPGRHIWPETLLIARYLDARPGMVIADIGAGAGYWTFRIAEAVGARGRVYAIDNNFDACLKLFFEKRRRQAENVTVRWVGAKNPRLQPASVDLVLMVDAHLFAENRPEPGRRYLRRCAEALRPGGRVVIFNRAVHTLDWTPDFGRPLGYSQSPPEQVVALAEPALTLEARETLPIGGPGPARGELPGYLLVLRKRS